MTSWYLSPILDRHFGAGSYAVVLILSLALLGAWVVGVLNTGLSTPRRVALSALRLLVVLILIVAMLRPARVFTEAKPREGTIAVLIDRSRSMTVKDAFGGYSRWEALRRAFEDSAASIARLAGEKSYKLKVYVFDADAQEIQFEGGRIALDKEPVGDQSAYGMAMQDVLRREDTSRLMAFVLAGDGALNTIGSSSVLPQAAARALAQRRCPLYTVPFGQRLDAGHAADIEVETMPDDARVFVKNELTIGGTLRVWGYVNRDISLQLLWEKVPGQPEPVAATKLRAVRDGEQIRYELRYTPEEPGEFRATVRAAIMEGEKTVDNNELSTYVTVLPGGLRVLYLEGEPRREQKFLRNAISSTEDIEVDLKWIRSTQRRSWPLHFLDGVSVAEYFEPGKYDVYVIGDLDSAAFSNSDWGRLKQAVQRGAGLIMLGGWHSFWPGGYQKTPLVDVLPIGYDDRLDAVIRQKFEPFIPPDLHLQGPQRMRPAEPFGTRHYIMRLAPGAGNAAAWRKLPPLDGANRFRGARQGATVLAESENGDVLLAAAEPGGRVLAFAGDSTWRWVMQGHGDLHRRFWRQIVLWLARKDEAMKGNVWVALDNRRYLPGMPVRFTAGARSAEGMPVSGASYRAELVLPDGSRRPITPRRRGDEVEGELTDKLPPGEYAIEVVATAEGADVGKAQSRFLVYAKDVEIANSTADPQLLISLSETTKDYGGRSVVPEELPKLFEELAARPVEVEEEVQTREEYYDKWYVFVTLVGAMCVEWFLRKRWRLV